MPRRRGLSCRRRAMPQRLRRSPRVDGHSSGAIRGRPSRSASSGNRYPEHPVAPAGEERTDRVMTAVPCGEMQRRWPWLPCTLTGQPADSIKRRAFGRFCRQRRRRDAAVRGSCALVSSAPAFIRERTQIVVAHLTRSGKRQFVWRPLDEQFKHDSVRNSRAVACALLWAPSVQM